MRLRDMSAYEPFSRYTTCLAAAETGSGAGSPMRSRRNTVAAPPAGETRLPPELRLAITYRSVEELCPYRRRLRKRRPKQIRALVGCIRTFGFVSPLVVDEQGVIIAGHGRLEAARQVGLKEVPVVILSHLSEEEKKALRIADNRMAELSGWDEQALALEFVDLGLDGINLDVSFDTSALGFEIGEIDRLVQPRRPSRDEEADEAVPPVPAGAVVVTREGDVWLLGVNRALCGDARDEASYRVLLGDERAAVGIHDFPYNVAINGHVSSTGRHGEFVMVCGEMTREEFDGFLQTSLARSRDACGPGALHYGFMDWRHGSALEAAGERCGLELKNICVWDKGCGGMGSLYRSQHEFVYVFKDPRGPHLNNVQLGRYERNRTNVWTYPGGAAAMRRELMLHATPKPVAMIADIILDCTRPGDIVLDAFSGSGTTVIAATRTGRRAFVMDLDPRYVDVTVRRWEQWSGGVAYHAETGLSFSETARQRLGAAASASPAPEQDGPARDTPPPSSSASSPGQAYDGEILPPLPTQARPRPRPPRPANSALNAGPAGAPDVGPGANPATGGNDADDTSGAAGTRSQR